VGAVAILINKENSPIMLEMNDLLRVHTVAFLPSHINARMGTVNSNASSEYATDSSNTATNWG
jgi:hypothetical protein